MEKNQSLNLRRNLGPYLGLPIIIGFVLILEIVASVKSQNWNGIKIMGPLLLVLCVWVMYPWTRYRIWLKDGLITRRTADNRIISISISDITRIKNEIATFGSALRLNRPFRRITIYGKNSTGKETSLDISLRHFKQKDISALMKVIHDERPELEIPTGLKDVDDKNKNN